MLNKIAGGVKQSATQGQAAQRVGLFDSSKIDGSNLPRAPASAFRKRPVRLTYDKNEFWAYRLPSEQAFLTSAFDKTAVFGKNYGIEHSPHIRSQMNLDSVLLLGLIGASLAVSFADQRKDVKFMNLRASMRTAEYGRFEADDFVKKH